MKDEIKYTEQYLSAFDRFKNRLNGESDHPFTEQRLKAIDKFKLSGFPTTRDEDWRFTNLAPLLENEFKQLSDINDYFIDEKAIAALLPENWQGNLLVFIDGVFSKPFSSLPADDQTLEITNLSTVLKNRDSRLCKTFLDNDFGTSEIFSGLNTAFAKDGMVISVPDNTKVAAPVMALYISTTQNDSQMLFPRNFVLVGENSEVELIQHFTSIAQNIYLNNVHTELILSGNSRTHLDIIQDESLSAFHISNLNIHQSSDSLFKTNAAIFGGRLVRNNISSVLDGTGIETILNGLYMGHQKQHIDNFTFLDHAKPHCNSHELYRGILDNNAKGVFSGKIMVRPDAQKTDAKQSNNCILLSDNAKIDSKPQLEIYADDVRCTHGATVGQLDEDALFYLRSRGIGKERARNLLIYAFAEEIIEGIREESVRSVVEQMLERRMEEDVHFKK